MSTIPDLTNTSSWPDEDLFALYWACLKEMASIVLPDNALYSSLDDTITLRAAYQDDDTFTIGS